MPWLFFDRKKESPDIPSAVRWSCGTSSPSFCNRDGIFSEFWDQHGDTILGIPKGCWWRLEIPHWIKNMYRTCIDWSTMLPKSGMFHYHDSFIHVDIDMGENLLVNCPGSGTNRCVCLSWCMSLSWCHHRCLAIVYPNIIILAIICLYYDHYHLCLDILWIIMIYSILLIVIWSTQVIFQSIYVCISTNTDIETNSGMWTIWHWYIHDMRKNHATHFW